MRNLRIKIKRNTSDISWTEKIEACKAKENNGQNCTKIRQEGLLMLLNSYKKQNVQ